MPVPEPNTRLRRAYGGQAWIGRRAGAGGDRVDVAQGPSREIGYLADLTVYPAVSQQAVLMSRKRFIKKAETLKA